MGTYIFIRGELGLISEVDRINEKIRKGEGRHTGEQGGKVDFLCMSMGYLNLGGRNGNYFSNSKPSHPPQSHH